MTVVIDEDDEPGGINLHLVSLACGLVIAIAAFAAVGGVQWVDTGGRPGTSDSQVPLAGSMRVLPPASLIPGSAFPAAGTVEADYSLATTFAADVAPVDAGD